jgi:Peptidase M50B-like
MALWAVTADWWARHLDTALHEGGHALFAWAHGGRVRRVHIERDGGGFTEYLPGATGWFGEFMVSAAGYASPPLAGFLSASLLATDNVTAVLVLGVLALAALLLVVENRFGIAVLLLSAAGLVGLERYAPRWLGHGAAYFLTWFLLLSGVKSVVVLRRARRRGARTSDADVLALLTHLPAFLWVFAFGAVSLLCLVKGAMLLVG